jgi:hypothetical protein
MECRKSGLSEGPWIGLLHAGRSENLLVANFILPNKSLIWQEIRKDQLDKAIYEAVLFNFGLFALLSLPRSTSLTGSLSPVLRFRLRTLWERLRLHRRGNTVRAFKVARSPQIPDRETTLPGTARQYGFPG